MNSNFDLTYDVFDPNEERIHPGFGHFGGIGRPGFGFGRPGFGFGRPGFGFGRPGFGFGFPFLTGLAAGALLTPGYGYPYYGYPYYGYPYYVYPYYGYPY